jgi:hypothetical protein
MRNKQRHDKKLKEVSKPEVIRCGYYNCEGAPINIKCGCSPRLVGLVVTSENKVALENLMKEKFRT